MIMPHTVIFYDADQEELDRVVVECETPFHAVLEASYAAPPGTASVWCHAGCLTVHASWAEVLRWQRMRAGEDVHG